MFVRGAGSRDYLVTTTTIGEAMHIKATGQIPLSATAANGRAAGLKYCWHVVIMSFGVQRVSADSKATQFLQTWEM